MQKILVIEDEPDLSELVAFNLKRNGFEVLQEFDGIEGQRRAFSAEPDLVILDLMLPGKDGYAVFKELRRDPRTQNLPVLILTARTQVEDRIKGLEAGADDYLTKPFSPKELVLRVQAILKRSKTVPGASRVSSGDFHFDKNAQKFYVRDEEVPLTSTEFKLLLYLSERPGMAMDRHDLLRAVWQYSDDAHSRTLDTHMKRLRQKLGDDAERIETVRGIGYRLRLP